MGSIRTWVEHMAHSRRPQNMPMTIASLVIAHIRPPPLSWTRTRRLILGIVAFVMRGAETSSKVVALSDG